MDETNPSPAGDSQATATTDSAPAGLVDQAPPPADPLAVAMAEADGHPQVVQCVRNALHLLAERLESAINGTL